MYLIFSKLVSEPDAIFQDLMVPLQFVKNLSLCLPTPNQGKLFKMILDLHTGLRIKEKLEITVGVVVNNIKVAKPM